MSPRESGFDPNKEEYEEVEDLPEEKQDEFEDVPEEAGGGFVREEAHDPVAAAKLMSNVEEEDDFGEILSQEIKKLHQEAIEENQEWDEALKTAKEDRFGFQNLPERFQDDPKIAMEAVKEWGDNLKYASEELRADEEVVMEAVKNHGSAALHYASEELLSDRGFMLEAVKEGGGTAISHAPKELQKDPKFVLEAAKQDWRAIEYVYYKLKKDPEFMLEAVKENIKVLSKANVKNPHIPDVTHDSEFMLEAMKKADEEVLEYASERLRNDYQFLAQK